jgi:hypothetical protein
MEPLIFAIIIVLIGFLGVAANEIGADSRDLSDDASHRETPGIA